MPSRPLPPSPLPALRFQCVWEGCELTAPWERNRGKPRLRLYCQKHKRENARISRRRPVRRRKFTWGHRTGHLLVRVAPGKWRPWHVVRYEQLLGRRLDGEFVIMPLGPRMLSMRNMRLISPAQNRLRLAHGRRTGREAASS